MHPGWMRYGLGQILIGNAIERTIGAGHATFDFLRGDESYKTRWADGARENTTLRFFDQRPASVAARWSLRISAAMRGAVRVARARLIAHRSTPNGAVPSGARAGCHPAPQETDG
jgi:CelD/BcsL family acetyltransferase involved in cellulose biosynthesis